MSGTYVYQDVEVKLTGRTAQRPQTAMGEMTTVINLVEITPVDTVSVGSWTKWVRMTDLFSINENTNESAGGIQFLTERN